jgi:hypothetical protein
MFGPDAAGLCHKDRGTRGVRDRLHRGQAVRDLASQQAGPAKPEGWANQPLAAGSAAQGVLGFRRNRPVQFLLM